MFCLLNITTSIMFWVYLHIFACYVRSVYFCAVKFPINPQSGCTINAKQKQIRFPFDILVEQG